MTQDNSSVSSYFTKLKFYLDELQNYSPLDSCICGVDCKAIKSILANQEKEFVMHFLMGLSEKISYAHRHILLSDPIPSITKDFLMIIQEEEQLGRNSILVAKPVAMVIKSDSVKHNEGG